MSCRHRILPLIAALVCTVAASQATAGGVSLGDVSSLVFHAGRRVTCARGTPCPFQMECIDGDACNVDDALLPRSAMCKNEGPNDEGGYNWSCQFPDLDATLTARVDDLVVRCEGYSYSGDPLVRPGSCTLQYLYNWIGEKRAPVPVVHAPTPVVTEQTTTSRPHYPQTSQDLDELACLIFYVVVIVGLAAGNVLLCVQCLELSGCCSSPTPPPNVPRDTRRPPSGYLPQPNSLSGSAYVARPASPPPPPPRVYMPPPPPPPPPVVYMPPPPPPVVYMSPPPPIIVQEAHSVRRRPPDVYTNETTRPVTTTTTAVPTPASAPPAKPKITRTAFGKSGASY